MRSSLLIVGVCFLEFHASSEICNGNQYTVTDADGKFLKCQSCDTCHEGYGLEPKCGSTVQSPVENTSCEPCTDGTFSNKYDSGPCYKCQVCDEHQIVISHCNSQSDTNCSQTCESGFYFARDVTQSCHKCSFCCDDEKDEVQLDCVRQGLEKRNQHCSHRVDKNCAPDLSTDISSPSGNGKKQVDLGKMFAIIFGTLAGVAAVILVVCAIWKRRQSSAQGYDITQETQEMKNVGDASNVRTSTCKSEKIGPAPQPTAVPNPGFVPSNPGTPQVSHNVTPHHTDDESDTVSDHSNRPQKKAQQKSRDSHIGKGPIKIVQQPKSQNKTEGSRVEFSCECQVQGNCEIRYQWLKDETDLQQQNNASLVLDSVRMQDFGCYKCYIHVTHRGGHRESVSSEGAFLEVTPCEGMRLKNLNEVDDLETQGKIASLLEERTRGLGGYRQIAAEYGMKKHEIKGLENSGRPGQEVMEFLHGSKPDLTVYSFCKMLKGDNMKRFDIVNILEDHLSIQIEHR